MMSLLMQNPALAANPDFMRSLMSASAVVPEAPAQSQQPATAQTPATTVPEKAPEPAAPAQEPLENKRFPVHKDAKLIGDQKGLQIYQYPQILPKYDPKRPNLKVIAPSKLDKAKYAIVLGETGVGKSTQMSALVNFLMGVKIDDPFRYQLIVESTSHDQSKSQTSEVNLYCVESQINYPPVVLIDTPGYGDTRGIEKDEEIDQMLQHLFTTDVDRIHLICFVTKSSSNRLTGSQNYVFNKVLQMFGKDVAENFLFVLTFCDGGEPVVVKSLEVSPIVGPIVRSIQSDWYLRFNNSAVFTAYNKAKPDKMQQFFWDLGEESMKQFMEKMATTEEKSLTLSKEVIKQRKTLDAQISGLQKNLQLGLAHTAKLEDILDQFQKNYHQMDENKDFEITVNEPTIEERRLPVGVHTTRCTTCNRTCHDNCGIIPPSSKEACCAMTNGYCTVCDGKCHHSQHINSEFEIIHSTRPKKVKQKELEALYKNAKDGMNAKEKVIYGLLNDLDIVQNQCLLIQQQLQDSIARLNQIALRPNCFKSTNEYIDQMIKSEKDAKEKGWQGRVDALEAIRKKNELAEKLMSKDTTVFKPRLEVLKELQAKGLLTTPGKEKAKEKGFFAKLFGSN